MAVNYKTEEGAIRTDNLQTQWLEEHGWKIAELMQDLEDIVERFEASGPDVDKRIQSDEYLALVRRAFRVWDRADTPAESLPNPFSRRWLRQAARRP